jgi:hypothetical protein
MRYVLIWWIINPHHSQAIHREVYQTEEQCKSAESALPANSRHRCSVE